MYTSLETICMLENDGKLIVSLEELLFLNCDLTHPEQIVFYCFSRFDILSASTVLSNA